MLDNKKPRLLLGIILGIVVCICSGNGGVSMANDKYEEWLNYRDTLGGEGERHYLNKDVPVMHSIGGNKPDHWINGWVTLVKNKVDHYCYVKIDGKWYVHLQGYRTSDQESTTGWFEEKLVVKSSKIQQHQLDIIGVMENVSGTDTDENITFDVYLNQKKVGEDISEYTEMLDEGTEYLVKDIKTSEGYYYTGDLEYTGVIMKDRKVKVVANEMRYQIVLDANGGSGHMENISLSFFEMIELPPNQFTKSDAIFIGWSMQKENETVQYVDKEKIKQLGTCNGDKVVLYAQWDQAPSLEVEDVYMYLHTNVDELRVLKDARAMDKEDGDLNKTIIIKNKSQLLSDIEEKRKLKLVRDEEYLLGITYEVQDSAGNKVEEYSTLHLYAVFDKDSQLEQERGYIRFISKGYLNTLEQDSVWKETSMYAYLQQVLN